MRDRHTDVDHPLEQLARIWDRYLTNDLDDEARRWHTPPGRDRVYNTRRPEDIEIVQGRGGEKLLTLADCRAAWQLVNNKPTVAIQRTEETE